jgi:hypothetical protein
MMLRVLTVCILLTLASAAQADPPAVHAVRAYDVFWGGVQIGSLVAEVKEENGIYHFNTLMHSGAMLKYIALYQNDAQGTIKANDAKGFIPVSFDDAVKLRRKQRHIHLDFAEDGTLKSNEVAPPESPLKRPPIDISALKDSIDPLTAALRVQHYVRAYRKDNSATQFTMNVFDGRKLFAVHYTIHGKTSTLIDHKPVPTIHVSFLRKALGGFTQKELQNMGKEDPVIDVYLGDDEMLLPVKAEGKAVLGSATAILVKECAVLQDCLHK